jgi:hypothetical protein
VLVDLVGERSRGFAIVAERLLDHARAFSVRRASPRPLTTAPKRNGGISR